jgi:hypothetical protein
MAPWVEAASPSHLSPTHPPRPPPLVLRRPSFKDLHQQLTALQRDWAAAAGSGPASNAGADAAAVASTTQQPAATVDAGATAEAASPPARMPSARQLTSISAPEVGGGGGSCASPLGLGRPAAVAGAVGSGCTCCNSVSAPCGSCSGAAGGGGGAAAALQQLPVAVVVPPAT